MPSTAALEFLLLMFAGWANRRQQDVIDYLKEENRVLREQLRGRRVRLTDDQRRRLAVKGKRLGRKLLDDIACIVTPDRPRSSFGPAVSRKLLAISQRRRRNTVRFQEVARQWLIADS